MNARSWHKHGFLLVWQCLLKGCASEITQSVLVGRGLKPWPGWKASHSPALSAASIPALAASLWPNSSSRSMPFSLPWTWALIFQGTIRRDQQTLLRQNISLKLSLLLTATFPLLHFSVTLQLHAFSLYPAFWFFFLLSHRQGPPQMLLRRKTAPKPGLLAVRALWLVLREKKHKVAVSEAGKLAWEKLFICEVATELVHGLENKNSVKIHRKSKLRAIYGVGLQRDCQREIWDADNSRLAEIFHLGICWGTLMKLRRIITWTLPGTLATDSADVPTSVSQCHTGQSEELMSCGSVSFISFLSGLSACKSDVVKCPWNSQYMKTSLLWTGTALPCKEKQCGASHTQPHLPAPQGTGLFLITGPCSSDWTWQRFTPFDDPAGRH